MADREDFATEVGELIKGRSPVGHTHSLGDVTGLDARLAAMERSTGARDISKEITGLDCSASLSHATIQRVGDFVELSISGIAITDLTSGFSPWSFTSGFRGSPYGLRGIASVSRTLALVKSASSTHTLNVYHSVNQGQRVKVKVHHFTTDPWPTVLPGDPA